MVKWFYLIVFLLSLITTVRFLAKSKKSDKLVIVFSILLTLNCMGRYMLSTAQTLETAIWANRFIYIGGCYIPLLIVLVLAKLCNLKVPRVLTAGLTIYSTAIIALTMTIGKSDIYYKSIELGFADGYSYLIKSYGMLHAFYPLLIIIYAAIMVFYLLYAILKSRQISFRIVVGISLTAFSLLIVYILERVLGSKISLVTVGYLIAIIMSVKYYERVNMYVMTSSIIDSVEKLNEYGYIVFDEKYRFMNANNFVKGLFPEINSWVVDKPVPVSESYLYREVVQYLKDWDSEKNLNKTISVNDSHFELHIEKVEPERGNGAGYLIEFVDRTLEIKYYNTIEEYNASMEKEVEEKTGELRAQQKRTKELFIQSVTALSEAVDAKDRYTSGHSKRVAEYARRIAERAGKSKEEQDEIYRAGLLHDVGKIRIPAEIINKPSKLTEEEYDIIKLHPVAGAHILRGISDNNLIATAAKYHHERYDGNGYPDGLSGIKIPEIARILGVADAYDAMASNRSYRKALPQDQVRKEIERCSGTQFDPCFADIMLQLIDGDKNYEMRQKETALKRVLAVSSGKEFHDDIRTIMTDEPIYEVISAYNIGEALEIKERENMDIIIIDSAFPEPELKKTIGLFKEKYKVPVVFAIDWKQFDSVEKVEGFGCDDYIVKPFQAGFVKEIIHNETENPGIE